MFTILPESMKKIGYQAFYDCDALTSAALYGDLGSYAFAQCCYLEEVNIPEGVKSIGDLPLTSATPGSRE